MLLGDKPKALGLSCDHSATAEQHTLTIDGPVISSRWHHLSSLLCAVLKVSNSNGLDCVFQVDTVTICRLIKGEPLPSDSPPAAAISVFDPSQSNTRQLTCTGTGECRFVSAHSPLKVLCACLLQCVHVRVHSSQPCMCHHTHSVSPQCHEHVSLSLPLPSF